MTLELLVGAFQLLLSWFGELKGTSRAAFRKRVRSHLRLIYFHQEGVLGILQKVAKGQHVSGDEWRNVMTDFDGHGPQIEAALTEIYEAAKDLDERFAIADLNVLRDIANGKLELRQSLRHKLDLIRDNPPEFDGGVSELVSEILKFNEAVETLDKELTHG